MRHTVLPGASLQAAIDKAQPGDEIVLIAGARYVGEFNLPPKPSGNPITIRTDATLPERRITLEDLPLLPTLAAGVNAPVFTSYDGSQGWTLLGLNLEPTESYASGEGVVIQGGSRITFDRCRLVSKGGSIKRGIRGNGAFITVTRSHIAGIWAPGQDSQAFCAWDGPGPFVLTDNYLEAASENVMFGGANSSSAANIPSDILVEGNHIAKPLAWQGQPRVVKNLFELKSARRVVVRNNLFAHNWTDGQSGMGIVFTVRNDEGEAPWSVIEDVVFEDNTVIGTERGINLLGVDSYYPSERMDRVVIRRNRLEISGRDVLQIGGECGFVVFEDNQITAPVDGPKDKTLFLKLYRGEVWLNGSQRRPAAYAVEDLWVNGNRSPTHRIWGEDIGWDNNQAALTELTKSYVFVPGGTDPEPIPDPEPEPEPEPTPDPLPPPDIVGPDVRLAVLHRQGKSHNWEARVDTDATDVVTVEFYINGTRKQTVTQAPYGTTLSLKGYRGDVTVHVKATDAAGNVGTASRTVVL